MAALTIIFKYLLLVVSCWSAGCTDTGDESGGSEVRVGILHSLTGTMAISEQTVVNAELMAISELNAAGGLLGKQIKPIIEDGESDWDVFAARAEDFTSPTSEKYVEVVFGCWTSASRKSVLPVFERNNHMLFYPVQYEGQECSKNIFYTGATPNQQIEPAVDWLLRYKSKDFFLVGSDYVFPRTANEIIRNQLAALGGSTVGEMYLPLGEKSNASVGAIINEIQRTLPNGGVIFNTLNGDSNVQFFHMFYDAGLRPDRYPIMSVSITETEINVIGVQYLVGHYAAWNFFMSIKDTPPCPSSFDPTQAIGFVERYQAMYGNHSLVNDPMEAAYIGVLMWAKAVELAGTFDREQVANTIIGMAIGAPEGEVSMQSNHHITKFVRLGQVTASGDFAIIYESTRAVAPEPWNTWVPSSSGYACDWSNASRGMFYQLPAVHVALVHKLTGPSALTERNLLEAEIATIRQVNREGGVNGKTIMFKVHDVGDDSIVSPVSTVRTLASNMTAGRPAVIFGTAPSDAEYDAAMQGIDFQGGSAPLLVNPLFSSGGECSAQVIHVGGSLRQRLEPAVQQFIARSKAAKQPEARFYIVGKLSSTAMSEVERHIEDMGGNVRGQSRPVNITDILALPEEILTSMPKGGTIVNLLEDINEVIEFFDALQDNAMGAGRFPLILANFAETQLGAVGDRIRSHWVVSSYFKAEESTQNTIFLDSIAQAYGRDYAVNEFVASAYLGVRYWVSAARLAGEFGSRAVQREMWSQEITTLDGLLRLDSSGFLPRSFKLGVTNEGLDAFRIFQAQTVRAVDPDPSWIYPELAGSCDFARSLQLVCQVGQGLVSQSGAFVNATDDAVTCDWCAQGYYSKLLPRDGDLPTRLCVQCAAGTKQGTPGQEVCDDCEPGSFTAVAGMTSCKRCDIGKYQDQHGQSSCKGCDAPMTTRLFGAAEVAACGCPTGMYFDSPCAPCSEGMGCTDFNQSMPWQLPGWYIENKSGYPVWRCRTSDECRAGLPGTCARNRADVPGCADCRDGYTNGQKGECDKCEADWTIALGPFIVLGGTFCLVVVHVAVNFPRAKMSAKSLSAGILGGLAVNAVLNFNVYQGASEFWESPLADFFSTLAILKFDLQAVNFSCLTGSNNAVLRYAGECVTPILAFVCMLLGTFLAKLLSRGSVRSYILLTQIAYINTYGGILSVFFISVSMITFSPFKCVTHPNGISSLESNRAIRCWSSEDGHDGMVATAFLAILVYPVTFITATGWCTYVYHSKVMRNGAKFLDKTRFLFNRFHPGYYYFGFWFNVRSMLLALTPVIFSGSFALKLFSFTMIFILWFWFQMKCEPWRFSICNLFDSFLAPIQLLTVLCFALLGPQISDENKVAIKDLGVLVITLCLLSVVALGLAGLVKLAERVRGRKFYTYFLSHHKAAAGVFARQVKMMLENSGSSPSNRIFLDVDNLENLDSLVFTVSSNVENMIVLLSTETLKRFWCAVEIVISHMNKVNTTLMKIEEDALEAAEDVMEAISPLWTEKEWAEFLECGVQSEHDVEVAYQGLLGKNAVPLLKRSSADKQLQGVMSVLRCCKAESHVVRTLTAAEDVGRECWIIYDTGAETQYCVCRILEMLMTRCGWATGLMDSEEMPSFEESSVFFVMLSTGIYQNPLTAGLLTLVSKVGMLIVPILNQVDYIRPHADFLHSVVEGKAYRPDEQVILWKAARGCTNKDVLDAFTNISKKIALKFSPECNEEMMKLEFSHILARTTAMPDVLWLADV